MKTRIALVIASLAAASAARADDAVNWTNRITGAVYRNVQMVSRTAKDVTFIYQWGEYPEDTARRTLKIFSLTKDVQEALEYDPSKVNMEKVAWVRALGADPEKEGAGGTPKVEAVGSQTIQWAIEADEAALAKLLAQSKLDANDKAEVERLKGAIRVNKERLEQDDGTAEKFNRGGGK